MEKRTMYKSTAFFMLLLIFIIGAWAADSYVEQKRVEQFYSSPENTETLSFSNESIEKDTFAPREYVKIKSLSS